MSGSSFAPIAVRCGLTQISVGPIGDGYAAFMWSPASGGPQAISRVSDYERSVDHARAYVAVDPTGRVLDLPDGIGQVDGRGLVHVDLRHNGNLEVLHESASGNSFATLRHYRAPERKRALLFAVDVLATYSNPRGASRLGRVPA